MVVKASDMVGKRFGKLIVVQKANIPGPSQWVCKCDCGNEKTVITYNLKSGNTSSCGCYHKSLITTHGLTKSKVYAAWKSMWQRCTNPKAFGYENYGGRGIGIESRWEVFENYLEDMGHPPSNKHTVERIDNEKNYGPDNCKWATYKEQLNNRRNNVRIEAFGKTQTLTQWAEEYEIPARTLHNRIFRGGMRPEDALSAPMYARQRGKL